MVRSYLEKSSREMEQYILYQIHPRVMDRTVISRRSLNGVMDEVGLPLSYRGLSYCEQCTVLVHTLRKLGWRKYSKGNSHRINAWVLPEVAVDVS
jgi:hypothetical protein